MHIKLITYEHFESDFLAEIVETISFEFNLPVHVENYHCDLSQFYHPARKQYDANQLLTEIDMEHGELSAKTIGLFRVDLFIPILTYIFGQAYLNGSCGIASIFRLKNEYYGLQQNYGLLLERFKKVIIHELGHSFGLKHCHTPGCVMISSTYVENIDQKDYAFCHKCKSKLTTDFEF